MEQQTPISNAPKARQDVYPDDSNTVRAWLIVAAIVAACVVAWFA
jgi:hypothetical protein